MTLKKIFALAGVGVATSFAVAQLDAPIPVRIVIDGNILPFGAQQPVQSNGRVLVPFRGVFERLGATVDWDAGTQTITAQKPGVRVMLGIGRSDALVNGRSVSMDAPPRLMAGTTLVPLRFVSEALGAEVSWNEAMLEVDISRSASKVALGRPMRDLMAQDLRGGLNGPSRIESGTLGEDTVIPWTLNDPLSSGTARQGDPFSATIITDGQDDYLGIPSGTQLYGVVDFVLQRSGDRPGVIELRFDRMVLPGNRRMKIAGRLIGLDDKSVTKDRFGRITAIATPRTERVVYTDPDTDSGTSLGLLPERPLEDAAIGGIDGFTIGTAHNPRGMGEARLARGTRFGVRLSSALIVLPDR